MMNAYCPACGGRIIPYMDMRDGKAHCGKCDVAYTIQEFWEILLKTKGGSHAGKKEGSKEGKEKSNEEEGSG